MKIANFIKNLAITVLIISWYAYWSKEQLHELSIFHIWIIFICVGALILHLLVWIDREIIRIQKERKGKKHEKDSKHTIKTTVK